MALVSLIPAESAAPTDRAAVESGLEQYGQLLNTWGAILNRPGLFAVYLPFLRAVAAPGAIDPGIKDASALLVGHLNGCRYTTSHRYTSAKRNGVGEETLGAVVSGEWSKLDPRLQVALELTRTLTLLPALVTWESQPQIVAPEALAAAKAEFDDEQLVELIMSISVWNALARFHRVMGLELDMPAAPHGIEPR